MPNMCNGKICEALYTNGLKTLNKIDKTFKILNRDIGDYVTMNNWKTLFHRIGNH